MRNGVLVFLLLAMFAVILAACGGSDPTAAPQPPNQQLKRQQPNRQLKRQQQLLRLPWKISPPNWPAVQAPYTLVT